MDLQYWLSIILFIGSAALWLFDPKPIRKLLGINPKDPYVLNSSSKDALKNDPIIGSSVPANLADVEWAMDETIQQQKQNGFQFFLTPDKRRCVFVRHDHNGSKWLYLMKRVSKPGS